MKLFSWFSRRSLENPNIPLTSDAAYSLLTGNASASGLVINRRTALGNPAIFRAVSILSQSVAKIPLVVYRRGDNDSRDRDIFNPAYRLLLKSPSDLYHAYNFKMTLQSHALLFGNGYAYVIRDNEAKPIELLILDPEDTIAEIRNGRLIYKTLMNNVEFQLAPSDILHIKGLSHDGICGYAIIDIMKDAMGLGVALQRYGAQFFKNNAKPNIVIELPPQINNNDEKIERFRNMWGTIHQGIENSHRPSLIPTGSKIHTLSNSNDEGQWLQSREHDITVCSQICGIPGSMLGSKNNVSYNSLEMDQQNFLSTGLDPHLCQWEAECETKLLSERDKLSGNVFIEFNRKALIQIDSKTETELLISQLNNGILSWEECRKIINRQTDKADDDWRRPANILVEGEEPQPPEQPPEEPPEPPEEPDDKIRSFTRLTLDRLITRAKRAVEAGKVDLQSHLKIWQDNLKPLGADDWSKRQLQLLQSELEAVLPEQRLDCLNRINLDKLVDDILLSGE
ncbi:MAG: phage portal protein [Pirellulaceae bacterium]